MYTLGIDIGSSFIKAAVFCLDTAQCVFRRSFPSFPRKDSPNPLIFEISAGDIVDTVRSLIDEAAAHYPIEMVLFSTQMHGFVYSTPGHEDVYVSWQDSRCADLMPGQQQTYLQKLRLLLTSEDMRPCGVDLKPSLGLCNLYALLNSDSSILQNGDLFTLGSYIISRLGGQNICHITNAAPLGLVDVKNHCWNQDILVKAGLTGIHLPKLAQSDFEYCGSYSTNGFTVKLLPDYGDQQVSILGAMAAPGNAVINIATACQVSYNTDAFSPGEYEIRPYFQNTYINTISNMPGGRNLAVITDFLIHCANVLCGQTLSTADVWSALQQQWEVAPSDINVDTLFWPTASKLDGGGISGIKPGNFTLNALLTASYTDMAEIYAQNLPPICGGKLPDGLTFSGGVSWKNEALLETVSHHTGLPYSKSAMPDEAVAGMYRLSLLATGRISSLSQNPKNTLQWIQEEP